MLSTDKSTSPSPTMWRQIYAKLAWALILACGFGGLITYQMRAGAPAIAPDIWPADADLPFDSQRYNLVMFAHPKCPCSEASLEELKVILTQRRDEMKSTICFFDPEGASADWTQTSLVRAARSIPGVNVVMDRKGSIAGKFGALTSGQILMFDGQGHRVFAGGITGSRGHAGDNRGRSLVLALAKNEVCGAAGLTPVYGCALQESTNLKEATP